MIHCPIKANACDYRERLDDHSSSPPSRPLEGMLWGSSQKAVNRLCVQRILGSGLPLNLIM